MNIKKSVLDDDYTGCDLENAYAKVLGGVVSGGLNDGGKDVILGDDQIKVVQIKSSLRDAIKFLSKSMKLRRFIPVCVGEPGSREEVLHSLKQFGAWIEKGLPQREMT